MRWPTNFNAIMDPEYDETQQYMENRKELRLRRSRRDGRLYCTRTYRPRLCNPALFIECGECNDHEQGGRG